MTTVVSPPMMTWKWLFSQITMAVLPAWIVPAWIFWRAVPALDREPTRKESAPVGKTGQVGACGKDGFSGASAELRGGWEPPRSPTRWSG